MFCIPKKNNKLCTIIDVWKQNKNMIRDVTSFQNQEQIQMDVAWGWYQSKINISDTYEHIWVKPDDVWKTVFSNVFGTFLSLTMQQGDCNAPATFQCLMTMTFHEYIGKFMHIYLDNIFIYSDSIKEHKKYLGLMYTKLYKAKLYLVLEKLSQPSNQWPRRSCGLWQDGQNPQVEDPKKQAQHAMFPGTSKLHSPFHARYMSPLSAIQRNGHPFL